MSEYRRSEHAAWEGLVDGYVLFLREPPRMVALTPEGFALWRALDGASSIEALAARIGRTVDEVRGLLSELLGVGLIEVEPPGALPAHPSAWRGRAIAWFDNLASGFAPAGPTVRRVG